MKSFFTRPAQLMKTLVTAFILVAASVSSASAQGCNASFSYTIGSNGSVTFTNTSTGATMPFYYWSFGDNGTSFQTSPSHTYAANGTYLVCLTMADSISACQDSYCDTIIISNSSASCAASFNVSSFGNTATFTSTSTGVTSNTVYYWSYGDQTSGGNGISTTHTYANSGTYNVCLTIIDQSTNCADTVCQTVTVQSSQSSCNAYFTFSGSGNTITFSNQSTSSGFPSYTWSFGDNTNSTSINPTHTYAQAGTYIVCLTMFVQDSLGTCQDSYCDTLVITGFDEVQFNKAVRVYPNPADKSADLEYENGGYDWIVIEWFSSDGRVMASQRQSGGNGTGVKRIHFDTSDMAQGIYFVKISTPDYSTTKRVSVIH